MPWFATTRAGVASFIDQHSQQGSLWLGADVLSEEEIAMLRERCYSVTVFIHKISTWEGINSAIPMIQEHHPNEVIWTEALGTDKNPRSEVVGQAFLWHEYIVGADFEHNAFVRVTSGPHKDQCGSLVTITNLRPDVTYLIELESGLDVEIQQHLLQAINL